jgi:hypothetical protein
VFFGAVVFGDSRKFCCGQLVAGGEPGGQPHVYVTTAISLAEFMFMKKGQWVAGVVGKGRFRLVDFLPKI